ncbi:MAG: hypothetical protein ACRD82_21585 [Blastocatellia bacterium]
MNQLSARFFVGTSYQFAKSAIDGNEQLIPLVELKTIHQYAIRPLGNSFLYPAYKPIKTTRTGLPDPIKHIKLQSW